MGRYICRISDEKGKITQMVKESPSEELLLREFSSQNSYVLSIKAVEQEERKEQRARTYSFKTIFDFTESIGLMLNAGLSLKDALGIARNIFNKGQSSQLVLFLYNRLDRGDSLYDSMEELKQSFPPIYRGLIKIGERTGSLQKIFPRIRKYMEDRKVLKDKILNALIYPSLVLSVTILGMVGLGIFVLPRVFDMLEAFGGARTAKLSQTIFNIKLSINIAIIVLVLLLAGVATVFVFRKRNREFGIRFDRLLLRLPFLGGILQTLETLNLAFALETLTGSAVSLENSLDEASLVLSNNAYRSSVLEVRRQIVNGYPLSEAILNDKVFPRRVGEWVSIGERSGDISTVFSQLRSYYQEEAEKWFTRFMSLMEPALIIFVASIIILVIILVVIPVFSLFQSLI